MDAPGDDSEITRLLRATERGEEGAFDRLVPLIYDDLRQIAHRRMRGEVDGHTLNTTAVVHEAYVLLARKDAGWNGRAHFFAVASRVMRHILTDHARANRAEKRGGNGVPVSLQEGDAVIQPTDLDLLALDDALTALGERDPRLMRVVECRYFGGMTMDETAEALGMSVRTATRDWRRARAYLYERLRS